MQLPAQDEIIEPDEEQNDQQMEQIAAEEPGPSGITNHNMQMAEIGTQTDDGYETLRAMNNKLKLELICWFILLIFYYL